MTVVWMTGEWAARLPLWERVDLARAGAGEDDGFFDVGEVLAFLRRAIFITSSIVSANDS